MADRHREFVVLIAVLAGWAATLAWSNNYVAPMQPVQSMLQPPAQPMPQPAAQTPTQPPMQSMMQTTMQPMLQPPAQPTPQPEVQPLMQQPVQPMMQPAMQSMLQPPAQPMPQPIMQPPMQQPMRPAMQPMQPPMPPVMQSNPKMMGGDVAGRLLNQGRPLVNCHVVIVPLQEVDGTIRMDEDRKPLTAVTNENGEFRFEDVPAGGYKLTWLPEGQRQWIRRIAMRPDVHVHNGEVTTLKEIRVALQTIN